MYISQIIKGIKLFDIFINIIIFLSLMLDQYKLIAKLYTQKYGNEQEHTEQALQ